MLPPLHRSNYDSLDAGASRHGLFSVSDRDEGVVLVLRVERILVGEKKEDVYQKIKTKTESELKSMREEVMENALPKDGLPMWNYRQPLAWGVFRLFNKKGEFEGLLPNDASVMDRLYLSTESMRDDEFIKTAREYLTTEAWKKAKIVPKAKFDFYIQPLNSDMPVNRLDTMCIPLKDSPKQLEVCFVHEDQKELCKHPLVRELVEFQAPDAKPSHPTAHFVNLLFVYPEAWSFKDYRNVVCMVELRGSDESGPSHKGSLAKIPGRYSALRYDKEKNSWSYRFTESALTQVNYHKYDCSPQDEIKIILPLTLHKNKHHLLFKFYNVSLKGKTEDMLAEPIGYCALPLYTYNCILPDDTYSLPVAHSEKGDKIIRSEKDEIRVNDKNEKIIERGLPERYLSHFDANILMKGPVKDSERVKWFNGGQKSFRVRLRLVSTMQSQDIPLNNLITTFPSQKEMDSVRGEELTVQTLTCIVKASQYEILRHLQPILLYMLERMVNGECHAIQYLAFQSTALIAHRMTDFNLDNSMRCPILAQYVAHRFDNDSRVPLFTVLPKLWLQALKQYASRKSRGVAEQEKDLHSVKYAWFFFELLFKSIALVFTEKGSIPSQQIIQLMRDLHELVQTLASIIDARLGISIAKHIVKNLALFLCDMACIFPRRKVTKLIETFVVKFRDISITCNDPEVLSFKYDFYKVATESAKLLDPCLNIILPDDDDPAAWVRDNYQLVSLLIDDVVQDLKLGDENKIMRDKAIQALVALMTNLDYDARYQEHKVTIAIMFWPLVPQLLNCKDELRNLEKNFQRMFLVCFLWILKYFPAASFTRWVRSHGTEQLANVFALLELAIRCFEYKGFKTRSENLRQDNILVLESLDLGAGGSAGFTGMETLNRNKEELERIHNEAKTNFGAPGSDSFGTPGPKGKSNLRSMRAQKMNTVQREKLAGETKKGLASMLQSVAEDVLPGSEKASRMSPEAKQVALLEGQLHRDVLRVAMRTFVLIIETARELVVQHPLNRASLCLLTALLKSPIPTPTLLALMPALRSFINLHGYHLFVEPSLEKPTSAFGEAMFRMLSSFQPAVRAEFVSSMYLWASQSFDAAPPPGSLQVLQRTLTLYMSRLTTELDQESQLRLQVSLRALVGLNKLDVESSAGLDAEEPSPRARCPSADNPPARPSTAGETGGAWNPTRNPDFHSHFQNMMGRLTTILQDSMEITKQKDFGSSADGTVTEMLLLEVAEAFSHMPENRIAWMTVLAQHHIKREQFAEAAQTYLVIAGLYGGRFKSEIVVSHDAQLLQKNAQENYELAIKWLLKADLYEQCCIEYKNLVAIYERSYNYKALAKSYEELKEMCLKLDNPDFNLNRLFGTYYRVGFYGKAFGSRLDGFEFVYKMPKITQLSEIVGHLRSLYSTICGKPIKVLPDSNPVDRSKLDPEECILQVTFVTPYWSPEEDAEHEQFIQQTTGFTRFVFSTPFTASGRAQGDMTEQFKRKSILFVERPFPYVKTVQRVVEREEKILSPIEATLEDVDARTKKLLYMAHDPRVNPKQLTGLLAGAVATQVHGGAKDVCKCFLGEYKAGQSRDGEEPLVAKMRQSIRAFIKVWWCGGGCSYVSLLKR